LKTQQIRPEFLIMFLQSYYNLCKGYILYQSAITIKHLTFFAAVFIGGRFKFFEARGLAFKLTIVVDLLLEVESQSFLTFDNTRHC